jgi:hypothetical protein
VMTIGRLLARAQGVSKEELRERLQAHQIRLSALDIELHGVQADINETLAQFGEARREEHDPDA